MVHDILLFQAHGKMNDFETCENIHLKKCKFYAIKFLINMERIGNLLVYKYSIARSLQNCRTQMKGVSIHLRCFQ